MGSLKLLFLTVCGTVLLLVCPTFGQPTQQVYTQTAAQHTQSTSNGLDGKSSASPPNCFIHCSFPPTRTQQEIDVIARDMTNQIIAEMQNGQLNQNQLSQPYWFEHRVSDKLNQLNHEQENVRKFYHQLGYEDDRLARQRELLDVQRRIFNNLNNPSQFAQIFNNQKQIQHQSGQFQEQTLNQAYPVPVQYRPSQTTREKTSRTEERVVYNNAPAPIFTTIPNQQQQFYRNEEQRRNEVIRQQPVLQIPSPTTQTKVISNHHETKESYHSQPPQPIIIPSPSTTIHREYHNTEHHINRIQPHRPPRLFVPRTEVSRNQTVIQTNSEIRRPQIQLPVTPTVTNQQYHRQEYQETNSANQVKPIVVQVRPSTTNYQTIRTETTRSETNLPPTRVIRPAHEIDEFYRRVQQQQQQHHEQIFNQIPTTQRPVLVFTDKPVRSERRHNIYRFTEQISEGKVPNYSPRVTLEQNMDLLEQRHHHNVEIRNQQVVQPVQPVETVTCNFTRRIEDLRLDLQRFKIQPFTLVQLNNTVNNGFFREGNTVYVYNVITHHFEPSTGHTNTVTTITETRHLEPLIERPYEQLSQQEYQERWTQLSTELTRLGYSDVRSPMLVEITRRGGFRHNGAKYCWDHGRIVQISNHTEQIIEHRPTVPAPVIEIPRPIQIHHVIETKQQEYIYRQQGLDHILQQIRVNNVNDFERNQTLTTGVFIRGGAKYTYDKQTHEYVRETLSQSDVDRIYNRIQQLLKYFGYRQTTRAETAELLDNGVFYRGGYRWVYESNTGTLTKTEEVDQLQELTQDEYRIIYEKIQEMLNRLGYERMYDVQCNSTIVTGKFERGGIYYIYDAEQGIFVHEELGEQTYNERLRILREQLNQLGHREISNQELHSIIYCGHFLYEGYRYEYNSETGRYEATAITDHEYELRLAQLRAQLQNIGYEQMSTYECNTTIYTGVFYYNGYDWLYNYDTNVYVPSNSVSTTTMRVKPTDETIYSRVTESTPRAETTSKRPKPTRGPIISESRGDQPPQVFKDDYEEEEEPVEFEPDVGYYPVHAEEAVPPTRVVQSGYGVEQHHVDEQNHFAVQQSNDDEQTRYEEEQKRYEEEQQRNEDEIRQRDQEEQLRQQEEERRTIEEQRRVADEQRHIYEQQLRAQDEQRLRDEELRRKQEAEQQALELERQLVERNHREQLRREEELRVHEELQRRQEELDRRASVIRQEEERKRVEELVREQNQNQEDDDGQEEGDGEGDYEEDNGEDGGEEDDQENQEEE